MKTSLLAFSLIILLCLVSCQTTPQAPRYNGDPIVMKIVIEDNIHKGMDTVQVQRYTQLSMWMAKNLMLYLQRAGFRPEMLAKKSDYQPKEGTFLLEVEVVQYNFRPVGTFLETTYVLTGKEQLLSRKHSSRTNRNWRHCVRELNKVTAEAVTQRVLDLQAGN